MYNRKSAPSFRDGPCVPLMLGFAVVLAIMGPEVAAKVYMQEMAKRIINTRYGRFRGILVKFDERSLKPVEAYLGINYASLLKGTLRFMPPTSPIHKWNGIRPTINFKKVCPQKRLDERQLEKTMPMAIVNRLKNIAPFTREQTEDCLNLNLYVPIPGKFDPSLIWFIADLVSRGGHLVRVIVS